MDDIHLNADALADEFWLSTPELLATSNAFVQTVHFWVHRLQPNLEAIGASDTACSEPGIQITPAGSGAARAAPVLLSSESNRARVETAMQPQEAEAHSQEEDV